MWFFFSPRYFRLFYVPLKPSSVLQLFSWHYRTQICDSAGADIKKLFTLQSLCYTELSPFWRIHSQRVDAGVGSVSLVRWWPVCITKLLISVTEQILRLNLSVFALTQHCDDQKWVVHCVFTCARDWKIPGKTWRCVQVLLLTKFFALHSH